jgi:hypothetical protein
MSLVGRKVRVTFNPVTWPIESATYVYEGHNENGHHVRRADGVQRIFADIDVVSVVPTEEDVDEQPH